MIALTDGLANARAMSPSMDLFSHADGFPEHDYSWWAYPTRVIADGMVYHAIHRWGGYKVTATQTQIGADFDIEVYNYTNRPVRQLRFCVTGPWEWPSNVQGQQYQERWGWFLGLAQPQVMVARYGDKATSICLPNNPENVQLGLWSPQRATIVFNNMPKMSSRYAQLSVRFGDGTEANDVFADYGAKVPMLLQWADRRPIGQVFWAEHQRVSAENPRGYFHDPGLDVTSTEDFTQKLNEWTDRIIANCKSVDAQAVIVWDLEGQQWPHNTTYVGSPDRLATIAPEMDGLVDDFMRKLRLNGFRVGITLRPQRIIVPPRGAAYQLNLRTAEGEIDGPAILDLLLHKVQYARERWGASIFYLDSTSDIRTGNQEVFHPVSIFMDLHKAHPDCLFIPERFGMNDWTVWRCSAPYTRASKDIKATWPTAFGTSLSAIQENRELLRQDLDAGNVPYFLAWYNSPSLQILKEELQ